MNATVGIYNIPPEERGYYELSSAIVELAVEDYRSRKLKKVKHDSERSENEEEIIQIRRFFLSDYFEIISGVTNPNLFLQILDEKIEQERKSGVKRKRKKTVMKCNG